MGNGHYRLTCLFQGTMKSLDSANNKAMLTLSQLSDSQYWSISLINGQWHRLTPKSAPGKSLDIINDANDNRPTIANSGAFSGQYWKFTKLKAVPTQAPELPVSIDTSYYYRLTTMWQGTGKALDVINDSSDNKLILAATGAYSGQYWRFTQSGGAYYMTCMWQGLSKKVGVLSNKSTIRL